MPTIKPINYVYRNIAIYDEGLYKPEIEAQFDDTRTTEYPYQRTINDVYPFRKLLGENYSTSVDEHVYKTICPFCPTEFKEVSETEFNVFITCSSRDKSTKIKRIIVAECPNCRHLVQFHQIKIPVYESQIKNNPEISLEDPLIKDFRRSIFIGTAPQRIKELRKQNNLTIDYVAEYLKISPKEYERYENGIVELSISRYFYLAKLFKVSLDFITGLTNKIEKNSDAWVKIHTEWAFRSSLDTERDKLFSAFLSAPEKTRQAIELLLNISDIDKATLHTNSGTSTICTHNTEIENFSNIKY